VLTIVPPQIEALEKAISQSDGPLTNATMPPSIVKINGENAVNLIERLLLKTSQMQDPDSQWNGAFPMYSQPGVSNPLGFSRTYMGESVTIEYDDGETATGDIVAIISDDEVDFSGIKTGEQFYQRFCNPDAPSSLLEEEEEEEAVSHTATETEHDSIGSHSSNQDSHSSPHWHNIDDETGEASSPAKDDPEAAKAGPSGHTTTKLNLSGKHGSGKHTTDDETAEASSPAKNGPEAAKAGPSGHTTTKLNLSGKHGSGKHTTDDETAEASSPSKDGKRSDTSAPVARREFDIMTQVFEKRMALEKKKRELEQTGPFWKRQGLDAIEGYPDPVARDGGADITAGYFLEGKGYEDVAVLAISGFAPTDPSLNGQFLSDFQETVSTFLAECKDQEKKKLVIDLTTNGGGFVAAGYELFSQLFPGVPKFQAHNLRETESLRRVAEITYEHMDVFEVFDPDAIDPDTMTEEEYIRAVATKILDPWMSAITSNLVPREAYSPNGTLLETMDDILGPVQIHGDNFTEYQQVPLDEISSSFNMTGVGSRASPPPAVFAPEDIVLLTDGQCGSTCTLFSYLMVLSLNVKTVVVGGRPRIGQMQSIAGVEGAQVFNMEDITATASAALLLNPKDNVTGSDLSILAEGYAVKRAMDPRQAGAINAKNSFSRADAKTPLQFLDQPANCRFFFTAEMLSSPELVWKYAADATWVDPENFCVEGSIVTKNMTQVKTDERFYNGDGEFLGADAVGRGGGGGGGGGGGDDEDPDSGAMGLFASSVAVTAFAGFAMLMALL